MVVKVGNLKFNVMDELQLGIAPLVIAGIIAGLAALGGSYASARSNQKIARYNTDATNAANLKMAEYGYSKDLDMWNKANAYNSPEAQQTRLASANLNPNLVYGAGNVGGNTTGQLPRFNAPTQEFNYAPEALGAAAGQTLPGMLSQFQDFAMRQAQIDSVKAGTEYTEANTVNAGIRKGILTAEESGAPVKYGLPELVRERLQMENKLMSNTMPFQQSISQERARSGTLMNLRFEQELGLGAKRGALMDQDVIMKRFQNEWMKEGVTGRDNIFLRLLIRQFPNLFSNMLR